MTDLIGRLYSVVITLNKTPGNRLTTLATINKFEEQAFYHWFYNIDQGLGFDKFFCFLGTIVW